MKKNFIFAITLSNLRLLETKYCKISIVPRGPILG